MSVTANPPVQASRRVINVFVINGASETEREADETETGSEANQTAAIATVPRTNSPNELPKRSGPNEQPQSNSHARKATTDHTHRPSMQPGGAASNTTRFPINTRSKTNQDTPRDHAHQVYEGSTKHHLSTGDLSTRLDGILAFIITDQNLSSAGIEVRAKHRSQAQEPQPQ